MKPILPRSSIPYGYNPATPSGRERFRNLIERAIRRGLIQRYSGPGLTPEQIRNRSYYERVNPNPKPMGRPKVRTFITVSFKENPVEYKRQYRAGKKAGLF